MPTGYYYHYKHDTSGPLNNYAYEVLGVGIHTEEDCRPIDANMVVYRPLYETPENQYQKNSLFLRPLEVFLGTVTKDGALFQRFTKISDSEVIAELETFRKELYHV